jgi:hypothetical protein
MEALPEGFVEVVNANKAYHIGKVLMASRRKLELDERRQIDVVYLPPWFPNLRGVGK